MTRHIRIIEEQPPFPGNWIPKEHLGKGLDAANGDLWRICFYDPTDFPVWHLGGFRTGDVQHFVNIEGLDDVEFLT